MVSTQIAHNDKPNRKYVKQYLTRKLLQLLTENFMLMVNWKVVFVAQSDEWQQNADVCSIIAVPLHQLRIRPPHLASQWTDPSNLCDYHGNTAKLTETNSTAISGL
jgi:hypothetical protein